MTTTSIWSKLSSLRDVAVCEPLTSQIPQLPTRSWAYHLEPIGIGTPTCESLTSHVTRLSEAHCLTLRALFERKIKYDSAVADKGSNNRGMVGPSSRYGTWQINGNGVVAEKWSRAVEAITQRPDLRALTFLPLRGGLSKRDMCRPQRAWCALCIDEQARSTGIIYEQLLWTHKYVAVCVTHKVRLTTLCATCGKGSRVLSGQLLPGRCMVCKEPLGLSPVDSDHIRTEPSEYEIFVANEIGWLISVGAALDQTLANEIAKKAICKSIDRYFSGNVRGFTKYLGLSRGADAQLVTRRHRFVGLKLLLRVAFVSGVSVIDLLRREDALSDFVPTVQRPATDQSRQYPDKTAVRSGLAAAAKEIPPPSLIGVAARLGFGRTTWLRSISPETCDLINQNYWNSERGKETRRWCRKRLRADSEIRAALEAALKEDPPPTVAQVAKSLGYKHQISLTEYFPDLCRALSEKRPKFHLARRNAMESELNKSLESDPPEEPLAVARRLGYRSTHQIAITYSQPFKRIRDRYEAHKKAQFLSEMRAQLDAALSQMPPPTLKDTMRKLGVSDGWLRQHLPAERCAIAARYLRHREEQSILNRARDKDRIKIIVRDLHANGTFPSMNAVLDVFTASALKRTEVWTTIKEAREAILIDK